MSVSVQLRRDDLILIRGDTSAYGWHDLVCGEEVTISCFDNACLNLRDQLCREFGLPEPETTNATEAERKGQLASSDRITITFEDYSRQWWDLLFPGIATISCGEKTCCDLRDQLIDEFGLPEPNVPDETTHPTDKPA